MKTPIISPSLGKPKSSRSATLPSRAAAFAALVAMLLLLFSLPGASQVVVNTSSLMSNWSTGTNPVTFSQTLVTNVAGVAGGAFTIPASPPPNGMLVVTIAGELNGDPASVTWGGSGMIKATSTIGGSGNNAGYSGIYYLANPPSGTGPLVVSYTGTRFSASAVFATGVSSIFPTSATAVANSTTGGSPFDTNTPPSITPTPGSLVVTSFGAAPTTGATTVLTSKIVKVTDNSELSQTTPPKAPNASSSAGSSHAITPDASPLKGRTTSNLVSGNTAMTIAFFDEAAPAIYDHLAVAAASPQTAGAAFDVTITGQDSANVTVENSTATVIVSSPSAFMEFDWNGDGIYGDNSGKLNGPPTDGVKTIKARNKKAETTTISAIGGGATTTTPPSVTIEAGAYTQLQILAPGEAAAPGTATGKTGALPSLRFLNTAFNVTVNAVDSNWNPVPAATADPVIAITSTDSLATLPGNAAISVNLSLYPVTFLSAPGPFTITATDAGNSNISATTPPLTVFGPARIWVGNGSDNLWDTVTPNWDGLTTYTNPSQVTFNDSGSTSPAVSIVGTVTPSTITVNNGVGSDYTFSGSGSISGSVNSFVKSGVGWLTISTANTYSGPTTVSGGILIPTVASALPSTSALTISGGLIGVQDLDFTRALGLGVGQVNLASGGFAAFGATGVVNLGGNTPADPLTMGGVGFVAGGTQATAFVLGHVDATRTIEFQNSIALRNGTNFFQVPDTSLAVDAILSGVISAPAGGSGLSKTGNGSLMLTNAGNTFNQSFVDNGTIILGAEGVFPNTANLTVKLGDSAGAQSVLDLNGFSETIGVLNLGDTGNGNSGTPSVINSNTTTPEKAAAVLTLSGNLNYNAGATTNQYGQATISANLATGTAASRNITVNNGSADEDLVISGALSGAAINKAGTGVLVLTNPIYSGDTTVSAGTLTIRKTESQANANPNNDASTITVLATMFLNLEYIGTDKVAKLIIGGSTLPDGVYGKTGSALPVIGNSQITGDGTITVLSDPYVTWAGAGVPFDGDANNDGVQNGLAWLLGAINKDVSALDKLPSVIQSGGGVQLTFSMLNAASRGTAVVQLQHSSDLGISDLWASVTVPESTSIVGDVNFTITPVGGKNEVVATIPSTEAAAGKLFSRLKGLR